MMTFANAWFMGNFRPTIIFVIAFLVDFTIRIFINPKYSPSMILGRFAVRDQVPEWAGAPQKRIAWAIGWGLAVTMLWLNGIIARQAFPATDAVATVAPTSAAPSGDDRCTPLPSPSATPRNGNCTTTANKGLLN